MRFRLPHVSPPHISPHISLPNFSIPHVSSPLPAVAHVVRTADKTFTTTVHDVGRTVEGVDNAAFDAGKAVGQVVVELHKEETHVTTVVSHVANSNVVHTIKTVVRKGGEVVAVVQTVTLLSGDIISTVETGDPESAVDAVEEGAQLLGEIKAVGKKN